MNIDALRRDTPGCEGRVHFNNAGAALPPRAVLDAITGHLEREAHLGGYHAADLAAPEIEDTYALAARLIGAGGPHEIALTDSATRAWCAALYAFPFEPGDRVLVGRAEYGAGVIALLDLQRRRGLELTLIDDDPDTGVLDLTQLQREARRGAALLALTHLPTSNGLITPVREAARIARAHDIPVVLDACQSAGHLPLDVDDLGCDILAATGRKYLRGPRGTGFLYVREAWIERLEPVMPDVRSARWVAPFEFERREDARRFELWERSVANILGLRAALTLALDLGAEPIAARITQLAERLRDALHHHPRAQVHDRGARRSGIVTFTLEGETPREIHARLRAAGINTSVGNLNSGRFDLEPRGLEHVVRASLHVYNTDAEIARFIDSL